MKKAFKNPELEIIELGLEDEVLTASGESNSAEESETPDW